MSIIERRTDEFDRPIYESWEVPPASAHLVLWRGLLTHPTNVITPSEQLHAVFACIHGWIACGDWWFHCGRCRPDPDAMEVAP